MMRKLCLVMILLMAWAAVGGCAESQGNVLGFYNMAGDVIGLNMTRGEIENILGKPLNDPLPDPVLVDSLYKKDELFVWWQDRSPFTHRNNFNDGFYCLYAGDIIVQYAFGFSWEEFAADPVYQEFESMQMEENRDSSSHADSDWEAFLPKLVEMNQKYAEKSMDASTSIKISV